MEEVGLTGVKSFVRGFEKIFENRGLRRNLRK